MKDVKTKEEVVSPEDGSLSKASVILSDHEDDHDHDQSLFPTAFPEKATQKPHTASPVKGTVRDSNPVTGPAKSAVKMPVKTSVKSMLKSPLKTSSPAKNAKGKKDDPKPPQQSENRKEVYVGSPDVQITGMMSGSKAAAQTYGSGAPCSFPARQPVTSRQLQFSSPLGPTLPVAAAEKVEEPQSSRPLPMNSAHLRPPLRPPAPRGQQPMQSFPHPGPPNFHPRFPPQFMPPLQQQFSMRHPEVQAVPSYPPPPVVPSGGQSRPTIPVSKPGYEPQCSTPMGGPDSGFHHVTKAERPQSVQDSTLPPWALNNPSPIKRQHNVAHRPAPMGNTCTYPYPHSGTHSHTHSMPSAEGQPYPIMPGGMGLDSAGTYGMMPYPKHYSTFNMAAYGQQHQVPYGRWSYF